MSRQFSMATVLRRTPFKVLRWFLSDVGIDLGLDWESLYAYDLPKVIAAYEQVPDDQKRQAEEIVRDIIELANQEGIAALKEAARLINLTCWTTLFKNNPSAYLQAIWAWTSHRDLFEKAKKLLHVKRKPSARKRGGLPSGIPPITDEKLIELKEALQKLFREKQKRFVMCTVESFERGDGRHCVFAYLDDIEKPILQHDDRKNLVPSMVCPVFEIGFEVDENEGTLAVASQPGIRVALENLFVQTIYGSEPPPIDRPIYDIEKLKDQQYALTIAAEDCLKAEISFMNLLWPNANGGSTFRGKRNNDIFQTINHVVEQEKRSLKDARVLAVTLRFHFLPKPGRRAGILCVEFTSPEHFSIRCTDAVRVEIMMNYLKKWGIIP